jgi:hypothetical protein
MFKGTYVVPVPKLNAFPISKNIVRNTSENIAKT